MASGFSELAIKLKREVRTVYAVLGVKGVSELRKNFRKQKDPNTGTPWAKLSDTTLDRRRIGYTKSGKRKSAKILLDTGALRNSIGFDYTSKGVVFGLPESYRYGETHQFGASKGQYGVYSVTQTVGEHQRTNKWGTVMTVRTHTRTRSISVPWGNVPKRPFMGFDAEARKIISGQANKSLKEIIAKVPTKKTKI